MLWAPEPLTPAHSLEAFDCGVPSPNDWLKMHALQNQGSGASRTFVAVEGAHVVGYFALASSAIAPTATPGRFRRNMPDPVPVVVLARLAMARSHQGRGLGRALFQDAGLRVIHAAEAIGIRGLLVHALSEQAKDFYLRVGLTPSPLEHMTLMVTVADLNAVLQP